MRKVVSRLGLFVLMAVLVFVNSVQTMAVGYSEEFWAQNNALFWCPGPGSFGGGSGLGMASGSTAKEKIWSYLTSAGLPGAAAAGIIGNIGVESAGTFSPVIHEFGMDSMSDIGTYYPTPPDGTPKGSGAGGMVIEKDVRNLDDPSVLHGMGLIQWSYDRRVKLLSKYRSVGVEKYATEWNSSSGSYAYQGITGDELIKKAGEEDSNKLYQQAMELLYEESVDVKVENNDMSGQNLGQWGITVGMSSWEAMKLVSDVSAATELFFSTMEMPSWGSFDGHGSASTRLNYAHEAFTEFGGTSGTGGSISGGCSTGGGLGGLVEGGMTVEQAEEFMRAYENSDGFALYHKHYCTMVYSRSDGRSVLGNCVAVVAYFIQNFTNLPHTPLNGGGVVAENDGGNLVNAGWTPGGNQPRPYAVFSNYIWGTGHTGLVLGVTSNEIIVFEEGCDHYLNKDGDTWAGVNTYPLSEVTNGEWDFVYPPEGSLKGL